MKTAGVILAAGASRRLGSPKQLAVVLGERLLKRTLRTCIAAGLSPVLIVLGAHAAEIEAVCDLSCGVVLRNVEWQTGAASSIRVGISALKDEEIEAALILTCDMPFVTPEHLREIVALAQREQRDVGTRADSWQGVPACFLRASFPALLTLEGDTGARILLQDAPSVRLMNACDVDTHEDLASANQSTNL